LETDVQQSRGPEPSDGEQPIGTAMGWHPEEKDHRKTERRYWKATAALTLIAAVGAIVASVIAYRAYGEARRQADAVEGQMEVARDTERRQLRAYLYVRRYPIIADQKTAAAKIEIYHAGATPAYRIKIDAQMMVGHYLAGELILPDVTSPNVSPVDHFEESILYNTESIPRTISMPQGADEAMRAVWSKDQLIGDNRIYLHGVVRYLDVFGIEGLQPERRYEFCFVYHPERDVIGSERGCAKYNKPG
jgi:hypothetical protein